MAFHKSNQGQDGKDQQGPYQGWQTPQGLHSPTELYPLYMPYLTQRNAVKTGVYCLSFCIMLFNPSDPVSVISTLLIGNIIIKPSPLDRGTILHNGFAMALQWLTMAMAMAYSR